MISVSGISPSKRMMDELLNARPGTHNRAPSHEDNNSSERGINFTMFLTMMSERLFEFDTEAELLEAFGSFDENDSGTVKVEEMKKWLSEIGDRMGEEEESTVIIASRQWANNTEEQMDRLFKGSFTDRQGNFNYREWVKVLRVNDEEGTDNNTL